MRYKTLIEISPVLLENEVRRRGMSLKEASLRLGYNETQLSVCCRRGSIAKPTLIALESAFGIREEDISLPKVEEQKPEVIPAEFDPEELYNTIYRAVRNAVKDALNDDGKGGEK